MFMRRIIGLLMMVGVVGFVGCGGDKDSSTGPSEETTKWRKDLGEGFANSVQQTVDGGFVVTGYHDNDDNDYSEDYGLFLLKTDGQGNEEWRKNFGEGWGKSVQQTVDGGFVITGYDFDQEKDDGGFLLKTDGQGNEEWRKNLGGTSPNAIQQTVDGGFIVTGQDLPFHVFLLKTDGQGNEEWREKFQPGEGFSVQQTADGEFVVTGHEFYDIFLLKTNGLGNI